MATQINLNIKEEDEVDAIEAMAEKYHEDDAAELTDGQKAKKVLEHFINQTLYKWRRKQAALGITMVDATE